MRMAIGLGTSIPHPRGQFLFYCLGEIVATSHLLMPSASADQATLPEGRSRGSLAQRICNPTDNHWKLPRNLEVPHPHYGPAGPTQGFVVFPIAPNVPGDLPIPVLARTPRLMTRGVAMPKRPIDEYGDPQARPGQIGLARNAAVMAAPTPDASGVQRTPQPQLRSGVGAAHRAHDPPALLAGASIGHYGTSIA